MDNAGKVGYKWLKVTHAGASAEAAQHHHTQRRNGWHLVYGLSVQAVKLPWPTNHVPLKLPVPPLPRGAGKWHEARGLSSGGGSSNGDREKQVEKHVGLKMAGRAAPDCRNGHQPIVLPHYPTQQSAAPPHPTPLLQALPGLLFLPCPGCCFALLCFWSSPLFLLVSK